jgi:hypothetical protein
MYNFVTFADAFVNQGVGNPVGLGIELLPGNFSAAIFSRISFNQGNFVAIDPGISGEDFSYQHGFFLL